MALFYFRRKYDCFGFANISWTRAIKLIFVLKKGFSNFEGKYQKSRELVWYKLYFTMCDLEELLTSLSLMPHR